MAEYFCTKCGAILNDQPGFDPDIGYWECTECGEVLLDDDVYDGDNFKGIAWFCDNCGALLNRQPGFSDLYISWECTECGYRNGITEADIVTEIKFKCPACGVTLDFQPDFDEYNNDWECTACGTKLHHDYSFDQYEVVEEDYNDYNYDEYAYNGYDYNDYGDDDDDNDYNGGYNYNYESNTSQKSKSSNKTVSYQKSSAEDYSAKFKSTKNKKEWSWKKFLIGLLVTIILLVILVVKYELKQRIPVGYSPTDLIGKDYVQVENCLKAAGFTNVSTKEIPDLSIDQKGQDNLVIGVTIGNYKNFDRDSEFPSNFDVLITYHSLQRYTPPMSSEDAKGQSYIDVEQQFRKAGFENIKFEIEYDILLGWIINDGEVKSVTIDGAKKFSTEDPYKVDSEIVITYHAFKKDEPK